jgi:1-aminocyclopropane-1-carboxylate deaminase/D-cysteine desulfhydrase-like pyridoxal-dependent ACC family enzyme
MEIFNHINAPIQLLIDEFTGQYGVSLSIKREDLNHAEIMGNKLRKLKYNLLEAERLNSPALLSFGGAFSNHILALSAAGKIFNIPTIGIIRGEELMNTSLNPVLEQARSNGMKLHFISRECYKRKAQTGFIDALHGQFGEFVMIPEGGSNELGVKGAAEITDDIRSEYDVIACACGTGGTLAGIIKGVYENGLAAGQVIGFPILKGGEYIHDEIKKFLPQEIYNNVNWDINTDFHFGGYAKTTMALIEFIQWFKDMHKIDLDYIYTGKMMYGVYSLIQSGYFGAQSKVLAIHTGGTQTASIRHLLYKKN